MTQPNRNGMDVANKTVLITGANRGIGRALVDEALRRGAKRVFAGSRGPLDIGDDRVTTLLLDVTDASHVQRAVEAVDGLDILINNAGIAIYDDLSNPDVVEQHLQVNFLGMLRVTHAFVPLLKRSRGAIVNNLSLGGNGNISCSSLSILRRTLSIAQRLFLPLFRFDDPQFFGPVSQRHA